MRYTDLDLVHEAHGIDVVPNHNMLERLPDLLSQRAQMAEELGEDFDPYDRLRRILLEADVPADYDVLICDPPATAGPHLYNAINATRSLVIPVEPTGKGMQAIGGLEDLVDGLTETLDIGVEVLAVVPNGVGSTADQEAYVEEISALGFDAPVTFAERSSLMEGAWSAQVPPQEYTESVRDAYDYEEATLAKIRKLAQTLERGEVA